jgi:N-methylhydantoinase B
LATRETIRADRSGWATVDPETVAAAYRSRELDEMDVIRRHAVILDWGTGELLPKSTEQFREMFQKRSASKWTGAE